MKNEFPALAGEMCLLASRAEGDETDVYGSVTPVSSPPSSSFHLDSDEQSTSCSCFIHTFLCSRPIRDLGGAEEEVQVQNIVIIM